jgi:hypothetical protein
MGSLEITILDQAVMSSFKKHLDDVETKTVEKRLTGLKRLQQIKNTKELEKKE